MNRNRRIVRCTGSVLTVVVLLFSLLIFPPAARAASLLQVTPTSVAFGQVILHQTSSPMSVSVTNSTKYAVVILLIDTFGEFVQSNNCPHELKSNTSCHVSVSFTPRRIGPRSGFLLIVAFGGHDLQVKMVSLSGTGVAPPTPTPTPTSTPTPTPTATPTPTPTATPTPTPTATPTPTSTPTPGVSLSGTAVQGPMTNSTVTAYAVNSNGSNGSVLGSTTTDSSGNFTIQMPPNSGPVRLTTSGALMLAR